MDEQEVIAVDLIEMLYPPAQLAAAGFTGDAYRVSTWGADIVWDGKTFIGAGQVLQIDPLKAAKGAAPDPIRFIVTGIPRESRALFAVDGGVVDVILQKRVSVDGGETWIALRGAWRGTLSRTVAQGGNLLIDLEQRQDADIDKGIPKFWSPDDSDADDKGFDVSIALQQGIGNVKWPL